MYNKNSVGTNGIVNWIELEPLVYKALTKE